MTEGREGRWAGRGGVGQVSACIGFATSLVTPRGNGNAAVKKKPPTPFGVGGAPAGRGGQERPA